MKSKDWDYAVLAYDPFAGDKDDGDYKIKSDRIVTARRERKCATCGGMVYMGTRVRVMTALGPDGFVSTTDCHECCNAMARYEEHPEELERRLPTQAKTGPPETPREAISGIRNHERNTHLFTARARHETRPH